jgi:hypothetical protein
MKESKARSRTPDWLLGKAMEIINDKEKGTQMFEACGIEALFHQTDESTRSLMLECTVAIG